jgi:hypothetical protein
MTGEAKKTTWQQLLLIVVMLGVLAATLPGALRSVGVLRPQGSAADGPAVHGEGPSALAPSAAPAIAVEKNGEGSSHPLPGGHRPDRNAIQVGSADLRQGVGSSSPVGQPRYLASSLRDPFRSLLPEDEVLIPAPEPMVVSDPSAQEEPSDGVMPALALQGILWGTTMPMAIIDDEVYTVGDSVQGATITRIGRFGVTIELQGRTLQLTMAAPEMEATSVETQ